MNQIGVQDTQQERIKENCIPKFVLRLEKLFDFQDRFRKPINCKTQSSPMKYEIINLRTDDHPQNVNLGTCCTPTEKHAYIKLFQEYKDVFAWTYSDLKTFDTRIM